ncbi:hypothetical protein DIC66_14995 [Rhodoferax lacus]|uniref:Uncharacterized protein n=1 Tax=Rhodoferax lacus TaxID=2184758 RepID=A0A3E1R9J1_9BURK|nr:hypothetical protein [Rhodoferax lacus]RFO96025.1 hypothetical protein DIC66_14995 [Rhodoferax lacus]
MSIRDETTVIVASGLRYKSKEPGSAFPSTPYSGNATMSCLLCGKHSLRSQMMSRRLFGKVHAVCAPQCAK